MAKEDMLLKGMSLTGLIYNLFQILAYVPQSVCVLGLFRGEITPLSSSYNIPGLVPVCWLLFQCF